MPKRKAPELTPAEQKKRFEALAREVGARQSSEDFKRTLKATLGSPRKSNKQSKLK